MPPKSEKQRKAMYAEIDYRKKNPGKKNKFTSMSLAQLKEYVGAKK